MVWLGAVLWLVALFCFGLVLRHAARRSVGTLVMVLFIPVYNLVYGFGQFEHPRKPLVLFGWLFGFLVGASCLLFGLSSASTLPG